MSFPQNYPNQVPVTPSDTQLFTADGTVNTQEVESKAIYVGGTGDITALTKNGATVLFSALPVGFHPLRLKRINATGTTATNMEYLF